MRGGPLLILACCRLAVPGGHPPPVIGPTSFDVWRCSALGFFRMIKDVIMREIGPDRGRSKHPVNRIIRCYSERRRPPASQGYCSLFAHYLSCVHASAALPPRASSVRLA